MHRDQILITGYQHIGVPGDRRGKDPPVGRIADRGESRRGRLRDTRKWSEDGLNALHSLGRHFEPGCQDAAEFRENHVANYEIMLRENGSQDIGT